MGRIARVGKRSQVRVGMPAAADGTFVVGVRWLTIAICTGRSSQQAREFRPDGSAGQESSERNYRTFLVAEVLAWNLNEQQRATVVAVVVVHMGQVLCRKSC